MEFITIEDEEGKPLVEINGDVWRVFDRFEDREPVTIFHNTVEDSPFYLFRELEQFDDADEILRKLSRKSERLEAIFDLFFVERSRLKRRVVCLERPGFGVLDEFVDLISLSGNQEEGFIVEATTQDDKTLSVKRNALGEVVNVIAENVFNGDDFIAAFDEITSDERWDSIGWDWKEIISNLGKRLPTLAKEVAELIGDDRRENPRRIKNEFFYFKRIESYFNGNRLALALESADKGIEIFPFCEILYASRGEVYFSKGLIDEAIKDYETAIHLGMDAPSLFVNVGICYGVKHDYVQAIESYTKAIEIDQKTVNAYLARACAYRALGKMELALKDEERGSVISASIETANQREQCYIHNIDLEEVEVERCNPDYPIFVHPIRGSRFFKKRLLEVEKVISPNFEVDIPNTTRLSNDGYTVTLKCKVCQECVDARNRWIAENSERLHEEGKEVGSKEGKQIIEMLEKRLNFLSSDTKTKEEVRFSF